MLILDLGLPDMDGTDVIRGVRGWTSTPIIVLSAWGQESQKVAALDAGADDYVTKPFGMDELLARLRAAVRRASPAPDEPVISTEDFTVDLADKRVTRAGADVRLTPTEWQLLEVLVGNASRLVTQRQLLQEVWGPGYQNEAHYLRVYIANLRRKLEPDPSAPRYLLTEPGIGYRFRALRRRCAPDAAVRLRTLARVGQLVGRVIDGPLALDARQPAVHDDAPPGLDAGDVPAAQPDERDLAGAVPELGLHGQARPARPERDGAQRACHRHDLPLAAVRDVLPRLAIRPGDLVTSSWISAACCVSRSAISPARRFASPLAIG